MKKLKVTVCELPNELSQLEEAWRGLVDHVKANGSHLVLLPEMPFYHWLSHTAEVDKSAWQSAVAAHEQWLARLDELAPAVVFSTRPVNRSGKRFNEGYMWSQDNGYQKMHHKHYLPDEEEYWEATWYDRGENSFEFYDTPVGRVGMLICTEMWFYQHARAFANAGVHLLLSPRATPAGTADKWLAGGRVAAVVSGAYCLSSNLGGKTSAGGNYAGTGWIIEPDLGDVCATTDASRPFATVEIDLAAAERAKLTYPRYVIE